MPNIRYKNANPTKRTLQLIQLANHIIKEYQAQGYTLTLRQLYYQFVARDWLKNTVSNYNVVGKAVNTGRMIGLIDWNAIEDRTRNLQSVSHWDSPAEIVATCARSYRIDKWQDQEYRVEVWIEKEALAGVIEPVCRKLDVSFFSCRGYTSLSEMWVAGQRLLGYAKAGQKPIIIHLGDHDPSGIDMTRDIDDRLYMFSEDSVTIKRVALNFDQIKKYKPPPNPAKTTDSRFESYRQLHGLESWELDALEPKMMSDLIETEVLALRDEQLWDSAVEQEDADRQKLRDISEEMD